MIQEGAKELPITDVRMTRFWLKLEQAVEMVISGLETMQGGELYVKKIPSMKMTDLAKAMSPNLRIKEIGIRPGEKIHEMMISSEDARNTKEFDKYYIILPDLDGIKTAENYKGKKVPDNFEYHSGNNSEWLTIEQMRKLVDEID